MATQATRKYTIDAGGKRLGRVASEAAVLLMGKDMPDFQKHEVAPVEVEIVNVAKINIDPRKQESKVYSRYSGYPGGLKQETMRKMIERKGHEEVVRKAVYGMLPSNRLRKQLMKKLIIRS
jgi:large subunit ribosomal protein L13